ncbi:Cactus-binding domain, C-terminal, Cactin, central region [Senna tora]|uniref:Splicing factor Cactin n=1 Tax=Senna tora TaxID=362788 RepID=A0A834SDT0_9FABA|nr:Cactus-binding domain, C-terminal, Cactin, central region [Senna tora]
MTKLKLFDAHCHLQDPRVLSKAPELIRETLKVGVVYFAVNGTSEKDWHLVKEMGETYPSVIPCFGLHPWFIADRSSNWFKTLKEYFDATPCAAVGEIGVDKGPLASHINFSDQLEVLRPQLELAKELNRPASVHCVDAFDDLLQLMKSIGPFPAGIILHSYIGSAEMVPEFSKLGAYFSFSGHDMSLLDADKAKKMIKTVPCDRILLETDAPDALPKSSIDSLFFVDGDPALPQDKHGHTIPPSDASMLPPETLNHPANILNVLDFVASMREISKEEVAELSYQNAIRLFSYDGSKVKNKGHILGFYDSTLSPLVSDWSLQKRMEGKTTEQHSPENRRSRSHRSRRSYDSDVGDDRVHGEKRSSRIITEEEIAEYIAGKAQRKAMKVARKMKAESGVSGYSNDSNPFGDSNLDEMFVWRKKIERDVVARGVPLDNFSIKAERKRQRESMAEVEKLKRRKEERAIEKAQREFQDWEKKEEEFCYHQSKTRSEIRLREGRPKPIDILTKHLNGSDDIDIQINEPYMIFKGLTVKEIEDLRGDIKMNLDFGSKTPNHIEYWESLLVLCDWKLAETESLRGVHYSVETEVDHLLHGKTCSELEIIRMNIESQMLSGTAKIVEFWEAVLRSLPIYKAWASLKEIHAKMFHKHLEYESVSFSPEVIHGHESDEVALGLEEDRGAMEVPKYLNRVHIGYVWNKYNQTHYDYDNLPPKTVQGYKFNIFYPDLVGKTKAPSHTIEQDDGSSKGETCIIRFHAGSPYEDIAFRIVNKEWEYSHKNGFKCSFDNGILRLYFNFKRYPYRR